VVRPRGRASRLSEDRGGKERRALAGRLSGAYRAEGGKKGKGEEGTVRLLQN